jgi:sulfotransferase family protein
MQEMWAHPDLVGVWNEHHDGAPVDWRSVLRGWRSTVDWPGCWLWQDFARIWPDAPILLSVRPSDEWYDSVRATIHAWTAPGKHVGPPPVTALLNRVWKADFGGWERVLDRGHAIACYERHNESVRMLCPPERLVEWTAIDGWEPLCRALDLAVPDEPFPHLNKR